MTLNIVASKFWYYCVVQVADLEEGMGEQSRVLKQKERELAKLQRECAYQRQAAKEMSHALKSAESTAEHARFTTSF